MYQRRRHKAISAAIILALVTMLLPTLLPQPVCADPNPGWYNTSWKYRKLITINSDNVSANLTNFPILISLTSDSDLASSTQDDGDDILFTDSNGAKLDHEIEAFNETSGNLTAWVRIPSLSSTDNTTIYMYYNNSTCGNQQNVTGVWDSNYAMVQHLNETSNPHEDSTSHNNDGNASSTVNQSATGQIDGADDFDGSEDEDIVTIPYSADFNFGTDNLTVELWFKRETDPIAELSEMLISRTDNQTGVLGRGFGVGVNEGYQFYAFATDDGVDTDFVYVTENFSDNQWHHLVGVYNGSSCNITLYIDGGIPESAAYDTGDWDANLDGNDDFTIGNDSPNSPLEGLMETFAGTIDEVRISDIARSADWIATSYNNQSDTDNFYSVGSEQETLSDWQCRKKITINSDNVSANLTNFPVLINLSSDSDLAADAQTDGDDILFTLSSVSWYTGSNADKLDHEIEAFNGTSGNLTAWVRIPSLSSTDNTTIYMYYGNSTCGSQQNVTGVWDSNYQMVQHLEESSGNHYDSTSNDNDGTPYGGITQGATGQIDGADDFDGEDDYITASLGTLNAPFTIEAWGYFDSLNQGINDYYYILMLGTGNDMVSISRNAAGTNADRYYSRSEGAEKFGPVLPGQQWLHIVVSSNTSSPYHSMYLNGVLQNVDDFTSAVNTNGDLVWGKYAPNNTHWLDGKVDEVRISDIARSADWIKTCYNNQDSPSTFYSVGDEELGWESYHTDYPPTGTQCDDFYSPYTTCYMSGEGFSADTSYVVAYYDASPTNGGWNQNTVGSVSSDGNGVLHSLWDLSFDPNAVAGLWHCVVFTSGTDAPDFYDDAKVHANKVVEDSFTVQPSAIPEFPTVIGGILVAWMCFAIYYWMRKRMPAYVQD